jgi:hypothetical protein
MGRLTEQVNYKNSIIQDSYGFKLSEIEKICELKGYDSKKTIMQYIVE